MNPIQRRSQAFRALRDAGPLTQKRKGLVLSRVLRADASARTVSGIAYPAWDPPAVGRGTVTPEEVDRYVDSWGTFMRPATVRSLAHAYMANGRAMDVDHNREAGQALVLESRIVRAGDVEYLGHAGAWAVTARVTSKENWERVERGMRGESGGLNGYSIDVFNSFREVEVEVEGEGVVTFGEFVDVEPVYLSLVEFPSIGETFHTTREAGSPASHLFTWRHTVNDHEKQGGRASRSEPETTSEPGAASAEGTEDATMMARVKRWFSGKSTREDRLLLQRQEAVARALRSVSDRFANMKPGADAAGILNAMSSEWWSIEYGDLDAEGRRMAYFQMFEEAMDVARQVLTDESFGNSQRSAADAIPDIAETLTKAVKAESTQRAGKKISAARLEKLVTARDAAESARAALDEVISDADDGTQASGYDDDDSESTQRSDTQSDTSDTQPDTSDTQPDSSRRSDTSAQREQEAAVADNKTIEQLREEVRQLRAKIDADSGVSEPETTEAKPQESQRSDDDRVAKLEAELQSFRSDTTAMLSDITESVRKMAGRPGTPRGQDIDDASQREATEPKRSERKVMIGDVEIDINGCGELAHL